MKTHGALYIGVGEVSPTLKNGAISRMPMMYEERGGFTSRRVDPTELPETVSDEELGAEIRPLVDVSRQPWRY